jgi:hypothetical protein
MCVLVNDNSSERDSDPAPESNPTPITTYSRHTSATKFHIQDDF